MNSTSQPIAPEVSPPGHVVCPARATGGELKRKDRDESHFQTSEKKIKAPSLVGILSQAAIINGKGKRSRGVRGKKNKLTHTFQVDVEE
ncbi:hypothetical protein FF1_001490 [Malus domestica]